MARPAVRIQDSRGGRTPSQDRLLRRGIRPLMKRSTSILLGTLILAGLGTLILLLHDPSAPDEREELMPAAALHGGGAAPEGLAPPEEAEERVPETARRELLTKRSGEEPEKAAAVRPKPSGPKLRGRVVDPSGFPITGAQVLVSSETIERNMRMFAAKAAATEAETWANGAFEVARGALTGSGAHVVVRARGYLVLIEDRTPDREMGDAELGTFVLEPGVVLAGTVVDAEGRPVPDVSVRRTTVEAEGMLEGVMAFADAFDETGAGRTKTDESGGFELPNEPPGEYVLVATHDSYPKARLEGATPPAGGEDGSLVLRFAPTARIAGRILGFPQGRKNVMVQARRVDDGAGESTAPMDAFLEETGLIGGEHSTEVEPSGAFLIEGLAVDVDFEVQAFENDGIMDRRPCSDEKTATSGSGDLELVWDAGASVVFDVQDASTKKAVRDVTVLYRWTTEGASDMKRMQKRRTFPSSHVVLDELRPQPSPGRLKLSAFAPGYLELDHGEVEVEEGKTVELGKLSLEPAPVVRVRVLDAATQEPISRARVTLREERSGGMRWGGPFGGGDERRSSLEKTDSDGWCELHAFASETATLTVVKPGYSKYQREEIPMPGRGGSEEIVSLSRGGRVEVLVVDSNNAPVAKARVQHQLPDGSIDSLDTDREGAASLRNLEAGVHGFRASRPSNGGGGPGSPRRVRPGNGGLEGEEPTWQTVTVVGDATSSIVLEVPSSASISGIVLAHGNAVRYAEVEFLKGEKASGDEEFRSMASGRMAAFMGGTTKTRTDDGGRFRFRELPQGRHRLRVVRNGGALPHVVPIEILEGENSIEVELPSARIEGRVVDTRGDAIASATVRARRAGEGGANRDALAFAQAFFGSATKGGGRTDFAGEFAIEDVPRDVPLIVEAQADGYVAGRSAELTVDEGDVLRGVRIALSEAGSIRVEFQNEIGFFQMVTASYEGDFEPRPGRKVAVARGKEAVLSNLAPGRWRVTVGGREAEGGDVVDVREGHESVLQLDQ